MVFFLKLSGAGLGPLRLATMGASGRLDALRLSFPLDLKFDEEARVFFTVVLLVTFSGVEHRRESVQRREE